MSTNRDEEILEHATILFNKIERDNDPEISHLIFDCAILLTRQITKYDKYKKVTVKDFKDFIKSIEKEYGQEIFNEYEKRTIKIEDNNDNINNAGFFGAFCEGLYLGWQHFEHNGRNNNNKNQNLYFAIFKNKELIHKIHTLNKKRNYTFHENGNTEFVPIKRADAREFYETITKIYEEIQKEKENITEPTIRQQEFENMYDIINNKKQIRVFHY